MSTQREVITATGVTKTLTQEDVKKNEEELKKIRADKKAKFARILERGFTLDRLHVDLPPEVYGEWVPVDQIDRWKVLGFAEGSQYTEKMGLHDPNRIGDTVFMVCSAEDKSIMEEIRDEQYVQMHGSPSQKKKLREEKEFDSQVNTELRMPIVEESKADPAKREAIKEAVAAQATSPSVPPPGGLSFVASTGK